MSSLLHLGFLKGLLKFLNLPKDQYCQRLIFNQFLYGSITYLPYVIYHGMNNDHARHALRGPHDYFHGVHACDVHGYDDHAHDYDHIYHVYVDGVHVNFHDDNGRAILLEELHFLNFMLCPYQDVQVLIR